MLFVHKSVAQKRYSICKACDSFRPLIKQCSVCHCFMPAKVRFIYTECPQKKWEQASDGQQEEYLIDEEN